MCLQCNRAYLTLSWRGKKNIKHCQHDYSLSDGLLHNYFLGWLSKYLKLYVMLFKTSFIADLEYRVNFATRILVDILWYFGQIVTFEVIYQHTDKIGDWNVMQMRVFLGIVFLVWMIRIHYLVLWILLKRWKNSLEVSACRQVFKDC